MIAIRITAKRAFFMLMTAAMLSCCAVFFASADQNRKEIASAINIQTENPIEKFRTERQQLRAMQKAQLNDIAHDAASDEETADMARRRLMELCAAEEMELTLEGILSMRGFENPVVTVHSGSVNVLICAETLTRQESSVILDLVCRETGAISGDIKIIPIN